MIHIPKLFSIAIFVIRAGELIINVSSKLAAEDYLGAGLDAVVLLCMFWARRAVLKRYGGYLRRITRIARRKIRLHLTRLGTTRRCNSEKDD